VKVIYDWASIRKPAHQPTLVRFKKKNCLSTHSYLLVSLPIAIIHSPAASVCTVAGPTRRCARPPLRCSARPLAMLGMARGCLRVTVRGCPLQVVRPQPPRCSCGWCLPSAMCSHCRRATASGEHHTPTSLHSAEQQGDVALKTHVVRVCFSCFRDMLHVFLYGCYKNRSGYCICCHDCTRMLQVSVSNVSFAFSDICCKCTYLDVTYVLHICCKVYLDVLYVLQ
jgi:hypothetical protein